MDNGSTVDGVRAVELFYRPVKNTDSDRTVFLQSQTRLNGPNLGTLMPADYLPVAELSDLSVNIFKLSLVQLLQAVEKFNVREINFGWISLYTPVRFLRDTNAPQIAAEYCDKFGVKYENVCFELSPRILAEEDKSAADNIAIMRRQGFHFMLTGFAAEGFSLLKTAEFKVDLIMLDGSMTEALSKGDRYETCVNSLLGFVFDLNAEAIAADVKNEAEIKKLENMQCLYYVGEKAGKYIAERYVRKRNE